MDTAFFWISKLVWLMLSPASLLLLLVVTGWVCLLLQWQTLARRLISLAALLLLLIGFFPVGDWLLAPLEQRFATNPPLPPQVEGIIVLGGSVNPALSNYWQQPELNGSAERLTNFLDLAARYPAAKLVFTGGSGSLTQQEHKEAEVANTVFYQLGFVNHPIVFEAASRNTFENAVLSKELVQPDSEATWILITSAFHMPRSVGVFCRQQWKILPYPVDHYSRPDSLLRVQLALLDHLTDLDMAIKEWVGLLAYRLTGKTESLFPGMQSSCLQD